MKKFQAQPGFHLVAHKLALDPGAEASRRLMSHTGASRAAYNWAVGWVTAAWWQRKAEQSYGIGEDGLTPWRDFSLYALRKAFNEAKHTDPRFSSWWEENSKEAYNTGLAGAAAAFTNYAKSKSGKRKGRKMGIPRFKTLRRGRRTCRFTTGVIRIEAGGRHVTLPRLGTIRLHEHRPDLVALIEAGELRILSATVRLDHERWFVSFQVEQFLPAGPARCPDVAVGIDLGIKTLAVMADSTGEIRAVPNPRYLDAALKQLRKASRTVSRRRGPDRRTGQKASKRWEKANAARNKVHHRVANLRADTIHKLTTAVAAEYGTVVVEDLNVAGMGRNRRLSRRIADAAFGEIRRQLTYKTAQRGSRLVVADRWYPSSKTCSGCGVAKAKLPLSVRVFACDHCGLVLDRDDNAALNLAALAARNTGTGVAGDLGPANAEPKPRGADQQTRTTRPRRKTGTGRAGGTTLPHQRQTETSDRTQTEALTLW